MRNRLLIQICSDLHLEIRGAHIPWTTFLKPVAPVLALAGDIGNPLKPEYTNFLTWCSKHWNAVFVIAGNHEFYGGSAAERLSACEDVAGQLPNVHFLQQRHVDWNGVRFLGATLWTDLSDPVAASVAQRYMNDYRHIYQNSIPITPAIVNAWHQSDRAWLDREISASAEMGLPTVVLTHHLPSFSLIAERWTDHPVNVGFASDCAELVRPPVRAWISGHTHIGVTCHQNGVIMAVNPVGYPSERNTGYCNELFVEISTENNSVDERLPELMAAADAADTAAEATKAVEEDDLVFLS